jgi:hypothetical protein
MQHDAQLVATDRTPRVTSIPLMPAAPSANPQNNSATQSTIIINRTPSTTVSSGMKFRGVWTSFTSYLINDVVLFNTAAYVASKASVNLQPDNNSSTWTLLSENFVFNASLPALAPNVFGAVDGSSIQNQTTSGTVEQVGPITPTAAGDIALLAIANEANALSAGWVKLYSNFSAQAGVFVKPLPTIATLSEVVLSPMPSPWGTTTLLFRGSWGSSSLTGSITSVQISSNIVTCQCVNTFVVGTQVSISGLTNPGDSFLNGNTYTITAATSTNFKFSATHADTGPNAEAGSVANLPYLQTASVTPSSSPITFVLPNPVKSGSVLVVAAFTTDTNVIVSITGISTTQGDSFAIFNNTATSPSGYGADLAYCQPAKGGATTVTITASSNNFSATAFVVFELPGSLAFYQPYDVFEFRGSFFVCLKETAFDAFADPSSWGQIAQGTGSVDFLTSDYTAKATDSGRFLENTTNNVYTVTLPATPPSNSWWIALVAESNSSGGIIINPNGNTLDGSSSNLTIIGGQSVIVFTDGLVYYLFAGGAGLSGGVNVQTINYTAKASDDGSLIVMNGSNLTLTLPNPLPSSHWYVKVANINSTPLTVSPNTNNIDLSASNLILGQFQGTTIHANSSNNYYQLHGVNSVTVPLWMTVSGPDRSGLVAIDTGNKNPKTALMGPTACGAAAAPTFRQPQGADLLNLYQSLATGTTVSSSQSGNLRLCGSVLPAGLYRISLYVVVTVTGAGNLSMTITWNDGTVSQTFSPSNISTTVLGTFAQFDIVVLSDGINDISYAINLI